MALTVSIRRRNVIGNRRETIADVTFDNSYPAGGESLTAADLGLAVLDHVEAPVSTGGYVTAYDYANSKLLALQQTDPADAGGADVPLTEVSSVALDGPPGSGFDVKCLPGQTFGTEENWYA